MRTLQGGGREGEKEGESGGERGKEEKEGEGRDGGKEGRAARGPGCRQASIGVLAMPWKSFLPTLCPWRVSAEQTAIHISIHDICLHLCLPKRSLPSTASLAPLPSFLSPSKQIAGQMTALFVPFPSENSPPCWPLGAPIKGQAAQGHVGWPGPASVSRSLGPFHRKREKGRRDKGGT